MFRVSGVHHEGFKTFVSSPAELSKSVLLLGGSGFVGRNVAAALEQSQIEILAVGRKDGPDLRDPEATTSLLRKYQPKFIINCAAHVGSLNYVTHQAAEVVADNSRMILAMYEAAASACPDTTIINPIANCAYPGKADTFVEENWWDGHLHRSVLSYGVTRRLLWAVGECFQMQHGVRSIYLLVPNMYGPYDSTDPNKAHALNALVSKFVQAKKNKSNSVEIWGTGVAIREWLYAKDFGKIVTKIIQQPGMVGLAEPINIGQNFGLSVRELVDLIVNTIGFEGEAHYDDTKPDGAPRKVMDDRRFRKVFPDFKFTPLSEGIAATIDYYERS